MKLSVSDEMALRSVLTFIGVKDLLNHAMNGYTMDIEDNNAPQKDNIKAQDSVDIIYKAIKTFL